MNKGEIAERILLAASKGGLKPFYEWYSKQDRYARYRIRKTFSRLRRERLIEMSAALDGKTRIVLTETGKKKAEEYQFKDIGISAKKKWDKKWRLVMSNIPEAHKKARAVFAMKLKKLGFHHLQRCVWVYPHECRSEINSIAEFLNIREYIKMAEAKHLDGDDKVKEVFRI